MLLALFFSHLFRTCYFPEWSRWIHRATELSETQSLCSGGPRSSRRLGRGADAEPTTASGSRGESAKRNQEPICPEAGCEAGRACRASWHKPSGRLLWAQGPGSLPSPGRGGREFPGPLLLPRESRMTKGSGAQGLGVRVTFPSGGLRGLRIQKPAPQGWKPAPQ